MNKPLFWSLVGLLLFWRLLHCGQAIDLPHDWRQSDTAFYIWDFYQNGIDLLRPAVCWMGSYERVIFECPLPEAVVALLYTSFGENLLLARMVFLLFFLGALYYLYQIVQLLWGRELARWASVVYMLLPLSWFYSRAIHIDFSAIMAAHAMLYYYLRGLSRKNTLDLCWSSLWATFAFLIKAPYAFYFALPMLAFAWVQGSLRWIIQRAVLFALPVLVFYFWQKYIYQINGQAPDWDYILHYRKFDNNNHWYFGHWTRRLELYAWKVLTIRGVLEVTGAVGLGFLLLGLKKITGFTHRLFLCAWLFAVMMYVLIFFNLNVIHNYYQLPLLAPAAIVMALGLKQLFEKQKNYAWIGLLALLLSNGAFAEWNYYQVPHHLIEIGQLVRENTSPKDLVIITYQNFDCRNPRILYRARRQGWSIEELALNNEVLQKLSAEGAAFWAYIGTEIPTQINVESFALPQQLPLQNSTDQLFLFSLKSTNQSQIN